MDEYLRCCCADENDHQSEIVVDTHRCEEKEATRHMWCSTRLAVEGRRAAQRRSSSMNCSRWINLIVRMFICSSRMFLLNRAVWAYTCQHETRRQMGQRDVERWSATWLCFWEVGDKWPTWHDWLVYLCYLSPMFLLNSAAEPHHRQPKTQRSRCVQRQPFQSALYEPILSYWACNHWQLWQSPAQWPTTTWQEAERHFQTKIQTKIRWRPHSSLMQTILR